MPIRYSRRSLLVASASITAGAGAVAGARAQSPYSDIVARPGLYKSLTEPPCSYCITQHTKGLVKSDDRVIAWIRAAHNGGAIPIRHFLAAPRVINDTYGLFFYDPDGGYVSGFEKDYGFEFYGWRRGVMVARGRDGTLWSALSGRALEGPQKGRRLTRIPSFVTDWGYWLLLHPESTAYDLYDGRRYPQAKLPEAPSAEALKAMGRVDPRLEPLSNVLGLDLGEPRAYPLDGLPERTCIRDEVDGKPVAVLWYGPTNSAIAFQPVVEGKKLTLEVDSIAPGNAPFRDRETGTRWSMAGRGLDGPLRGRELPWASSIQCRWYAWASEHPGTTLHRPPAPSR